MATYAEPEMLKEWHEILGLPTDEDSIEEAWQELLDRTGEAIYEATENAKANWAKQNPGQRLDENIDEWMKIHEQAHYIGSELVLEEMYLEPIRALRMQQMQEEEAEEFDPDKSPMDADSWEEYYRLVDARYGKSGAGKMY
ncbi:MULTISPECIES: hypothetical protein [unclassified Corynebacterium]|uniref:hypothetical protein n=1 Tax=unclassified Corynebacterium TaxID=2624378 RepID=UPI00124DB37E|nr:MULTISPECIES: hypothetical protein [unclassified Corynebacterium]